MTERRTRDEGASQTMQIMEAVRRRRDELGWSAGRLADEMSGVGVPWNADIVVNLEHGRRRSLRVHELVALSWVLDMDTPLDLLVPEVRKDPTYPVTPSTLLDRKTVRAWFEGETGSLRKWLAQPAEGEPEDLAAVLDQVPPEMREQILMLARSASKGPARIQVSGPEDGADEPD